MKRRCGLDGTYLDGFQEITGVPVVTWKMIVKLDSVSSCKRPVDLFMSFKWESRQDSTITSRLVVVKSPLVIIKVEISKLTIEADHLKQMVIDLESEKEILFTEKSILESEKIPINWRVRICRLKLQMYLLNLRKKLRRSMKRN